MTAVRIILDIAERSVVVACSACPWWAEVTTTAAAAERVACDHEAAEHPGTYTARDRAAHVRHRARHAARTEMPPRPS